jgi:PCFT/HCP family folate transporter-like MFS transporter 1/3
MSKIISSFVYAFAANTWQLYMGPIAEILNGTSFIAMRSIASKLVQSDELVNSFAGFLRNFQLKCFFKGKVNSLFGVGEALMPLLYAPMYTQVYRNTIDTLPGAFFLLGGALTTPAVFIFL